MGRGVGQCGCRPVFPFFATIDLKESLKYVVHSVSGWDSNFLVTHVPSKLSATSMTQPNAQYIAF